MPRIARYQFNNKIRLEAWETLQWLRQTNRITQFRQACWAFHDHTAHLPPQCSRATLLALYIGPLTDPKNPLHIQDLCEQLRVKPVLPSAVQRLSSRSASGPWIPMPGAVQRLSSRPAHGPWIPFRKDDEIPVFKWGPTMGTDGSLISQGWAPGEPGVVSMRWSRGIAAASADVDREDGEKDIDGDIDMDRPEIEQTRTFNSDHVINQIHWSSDSILYDTYYEIGDPELRLLCQLNQILAEYATELAETALEDADEEAYMRDLQPRTEQWYQILRARAFHLYEPGPESRWWVAVMETQRAQRAPSPNKDDPFMCGICREEGDGKLDYPLFFCGHEFCADCILRWMMQSIRCPLCRKVMDPPHVLAHVPSADIDGTLAESLSQSLMIKTFYGDRAAAYWAKQK